MAPNESQPSQTIPSAARVERKLEDTLMAEIVEATLGADAQRVLYLEVQGGGE
ncbi:MAG: hypothetical protein KDD82_26220 [Planctomycetes bacterium]|nr:hypothetical protein [Planctomycetota bacterium]